MTYNLFVQIVADGPVTADLVEFDSSDEYDAVFGHELRSGEWTWPEVLEAIAKYQPSLIKVNHYTE